MRCGGEEAPPPRRHAAIAGVISTPEARDLKLPYVCAKTSTWTIAFLYDYKITRLCLQEVFFGPTSRP